MRDAFTGVRFLDPLRLEYRNDRLWHLRHELRCVWHGGQVTVPAGFVTDLSSVPRIFRSLIPGIGPENRPSVVHDWLYVEEPPGWTRLAADRLFEAGLAAEGVGWLQRRAMYLAVRAGGASLWARDPA